MEKTGLEDCLRSTGAYATPAGRRLWITRLPGLCAGWFYWRVVWRSLVAACQATLGVWTIERFRRNSNVILCAAEQAGCRVEPIVLDVCDDASVAGAMAQVHDAVGALDVLINNAGIGMNAAVEDVDIEAAKAVFDTNYAGPRMPRRLPRPRLPRPRLPLTRTWRYRGVFRRAFSRSWPSSACGATTRNERSQAFALTY